MFLHTQLLDGGSDFLNYNDPDAADSAYGGGHFRDSTIEPLSIRNSFANANTNFANIMIEGCKGNMMPYHQEQGNFSDKKGTCLIDNKIEIRQGSYDWYEDAQDMAMALTGSAFEMTPFAFVTTTRAGVSRTSNILSKEGYVSDGEYISTPFVDEDVDTKYFKGQYRQLTASGSGDAPREGIVTALLASSSFTLSTIGTRFKSNQNGFIITPKYDDTIQTVLGVDSVAFSGLLRN